jgi:hypothetical protein
VLPVSSGAQTERETLDAVLHEVVETLAPLDRTPCSPGERRAAEWLAERLGAVEGVEVALEDEPSWGTFPPTSATLGALGTIAALLVLRGRRGAGGLLAAAAFAGIVDEAHNGPRVVRRLLRRRRQTVNVVARLDGGGASAGEGAGAGAGAATSAPATLVVLAHHDAPQTGMLFDQTLQRRLYERAPQVLERFKTPLPQWWFGLAGPLLSVAAAISARRRLAVPALASGAIGTALVADLWRSETVPGANDNLSGVAALVGLAHELRERPAPGLRVLLVSCGAEETLQDGIRAFVARHRDELSPERTWFVNLDTIGSPHLVMLDAEGPVRMEYYTGRWLSDLVAEHAERLGITLHQGFRARASTDSVIPSRAGYAIATLVSMTDWRSPANYHLPSDIPENLDYGTVREATLLVAELARELAETPRGRGRSALQS